MIIEYIPIGNALNISVSNFRTARGDTPITDATLKFSIYDSAGVVVTGADAIPMTAVENPETLAFNDYLGMISDVVFSEGEEYQIVVYGVNYNVRWERWFNARSRVFGD